jgi:hypothetical protein
VNSTHNVEGKQSAALGRKTRDIDLARAAMLRAFSRGNAFHRLHDAPPLAGMPAGPLAHKIDPRPIPSKTKANERNTPILVNAYGGKALSNVTNLSRSFAWATFPCRSSLFHICLPFHCPFKALLLENRISRAWLWAGIRSGLPLICAFRQVLIFQGET